MKLRYMSMASFLFLSFLSFAQKEDLNARDPRLNEGSLFTIKFTPGSKRIDVSFAGKPAALLGPDQVEVMGRDLSSGKSKNLNIKPVEDHFEVVDPLNSSAPVEFDVKDKANQKKETFKFNSKR